MVLHGLVCYGTKLAAGLNNGGIYTSINSGLTWATTGAPGASWESVASSGDGTKLAAAVHGGGIYISTNSGIAWTQTSAPVKDWRSIASSADGTRLVAADSGGTIWTAEATIQTSTPRLLVNHSDNTIKVYWQAVSGWILQQSTTLGITAIWSDSSGVVSSNGTNYVSLVDPNDRLFLRLKR